MTKKKVRVDGAVRVRIATQVEVRKRFGDKRINAAYKRLCCKCAFADICLLVPLTTRGKNCPYFKEVKDATNNTDTS